MDTKPTAVNIDALGKLFAKNVEDDVVNNIFNKVDFSKVDISKLKLKKRYNPESFKKAVARGEVSLSKMAEADLKAAFGEQGKQFLDGTDQLIFTEAALSKELWRGTLQVAFKVMMSDPDKYRYLTSAYIHKDKKITDVLGNVFDSIATGEIAETVLAGAL